MHRLRVRADHGVLVSDGNVGSDAEKVLVFDLLDNILQKSFYHLSLDWNDLGVCRNDHIHRDTAKDRANFPLCGQS